MLFRGILPTIKTPNLELCKCLEVVNCAKYLLRFCWDFLSSWDQCCAEKTLHNAQLLERAIITGGIYILFFILLFFFPAAFCTLLPPTPHLGPFGPTLSSLMHASHVRPPAEIQTRKLGKTQDNDIENAETVVSVYCVVQERAVKDGTI